MNDPEQEPLVIQARNASAWYANHPPPHTEGLPELLWELAEEIETLERAIAMKNEAHRLQQQRIEELERTHEELQKALKRIRTAEEVLAQWREGT